jgi:hypothetical protein
MSGRRSLRSNCHRRWMPRCWWWPQKYCTRLDNRTELCNWLTGLSRRCPATRGCAPGRRLWPQRSPPIEIDLQALILGIELEPDATPEPEAGREAEPEAVPPLDGDRLQADAGETNDDDAGRGSMAR